MDIDLHYGGAQGGDTVRLRISPAELRVLLQTLYPLSGWEQDQDVTFLLHGRLEVTNASQVASTTRVPECHVRASVDQGSSLRQQRALAGPREAQGEIGWKENLGQENDEEVGEEVEG